MSSGCPSISGVIMGGGLFKTSWKCSFHLFSCSSFFEITLPLLSFTGELVIGTQLSGGVIERFYVSFATGSFCFFC